MTCQSASCRGLDTPPSHALPAGPAGPPRRQRSALAGRLAAPPRLLSTQARTCLTALPARLALLALLALVVAAPAAAPASAQSLYGSHESMVRQNLVAQQHDYAYLRTTQEVVQAVGSGALVAVNGNEDLELAGEEVSFPYARPEVKTFLEQLAHAYRAACGEPLVVTSLVRPISRQPWNASPISVHPTGMAVDMRRSDRHGCRVWLESTLLALEGEGMIEATRERWPPHYHVAVFPDPLLLPGPIGDPNGVVRVAAFAALHGGAVERGERDVRSASELDSDAEPVARHGRVHVARSSRTGRFRITQTAVAHRSQRPAAADGRIVVHRHGTRRGQAGRDRQAAATHRSGARAASGTRAVPAVSAKHHSRSRAAARGTATATAR